MVGKQAVVLEDMRRDLTSGHINAKSPWSLPSNAVRVVDNTTPEVVEGRLAALRQLGNLRWLRSLHKFYSVIVRP